MGQAWWQGTGQRLAAAAPDAVLGRLTASSPFEVTPTQTGAWKATIANLQSVAAALPEAGFFLEFAIPRMGRRADAVIVHAGTIFVLEYKVGAREFARHARLQVEGYALDLAHFHATSADRPLVPVLIATAAPPQDIPLLTAPGPVVRPVLALAPDDLLLAIRQQIAAAPAELLDPIEWAAGAYRPTPTIIEAAQALFGGHQVAAIARSGAANLEGTTDAIDRIIARAARENRKALLFVTGVPGAGKTLAGLAIAARHMNAAGAIPATYLSGNGPLVAVLQKALIDDERRRLRAPEPGDPPPMGRRKADVFIQNVHRFRDTAADSSLPPADRIVIFDEAQRAWTAAETARFMMQKRGHAEWKQSEPAFLLSVMNRARDSRIVICLVGEGQEINRGEAGIGAWVEALTASAFRDWEVHASGHLLAREAGLDRQLRTWLEGRVGEGNPLLHLNVSLRSFRASALSDFVAALLGPDAAVARSLLPDPTQYPIVRTRSLVAARAWLRARSRGLERSGIVASANGLRLKPEGLFVKAKIDPTNWFLKPADDIRSSSMLEDVATEFDVQGLELDWTAVAWDLDLSRGQGGWVARSFKGSRWEPKDAGGYLNERRAYAINSYRVLLTRARQGMVIVVPNGSTDDATRPPAAYDAIDRWLSDCGIAKLPQ